MHNAADEGCARLPSRFHIWHLITRSNCGLDEERDGASQNRWHLSGQQNCAQRDSEDRQSLQVLARVLAASSPWSRIVRVSTLTDTDRTSVLLLWSI